MNERWHRLKAYLLTQFNQASTWRGLTVMISAASATFKTEWAEAIIAGGLFVSGIIAVLFPDDLKK